MVASIPSPEQAIWHLGPFPLRAYALCIIAGIIVGVWIGDRRWRARGGSPGAVADVAMWAVPFGIVGARVYHVITSPQAYFGAGGDPVAALKIWQGGLAIWGAVAFGLLGAWIGCRRHGIALPPFADAVAPGLAVAQAFGRWGNWFNIELFGSPTDLPWGLEVPASHRPPGYEAYATFHPTFLYESLWCLAIAAIVVWADRRFRMGHGRVFALYVLLYVLGRAWWEALRIDEANVIFGWRVNHWVSLLVGIGALAYLVISARLRPGREAVVEQAREPEPEGDAVAEESLARAEPEPAAEGGSTPEGPAG